MRLPVIIARSLACLFIALHHLAYATSPPVINTHSALYTIPDDTLFYIGGYEGIPLQQMLRSIPQFNMEYSTIVQELEKPSSTPPTPGIQLLKYLFIDYLRAIQTPSKFLSHYGLADTPEIHLYTIGFLPVLRISFKDPSILQKRIAKITATHQISSIPGKLNNIPYQRYLLGKHSPQLGKLSLLMSWQQNQLILTLDTETLSSSVLPLILGVQRPKKPLANSSLLTSLIQRYQFLPYGLGFLNHKAILQGLTNTDNNHLSTMLQQFPNTSKSLAMFRTPECSKEFNRIAKYWPRTVFGYTQFNDTHIDTSLIIENTDSELMQQFHSLRGHIPNFLANQTEQPYFALAQGIHIDTVATVLMKIWNRLVQPVSKCPQIAQAQQRLTQANPAASAMLFGSITGFRGISFSLFNMQLNTPDTTEQTKKTTSPSSTASSNTSQQAGLPLQSISALLTLSSLNPELLFGSIALALPELANTPLPKDGSALTLPLPPTIKTTLPQDIKIALRGKHLVIYTGEKAEQVAQQLEKEALTANGFFFVALDYLQYFNFVNDMLSYAPQTPNINAADNKENVQKLINTLQNFALYFTLHADLQQYGITLKSYIKMDRKNNTQ